MCYFVLAVTPYTSSAISRTLRCGPQVCFGMQLYVLVISKQSKFTNKEALHQQQPPSGTLQHKTLNSKKLPTSDPVAKWQ